MNAETLAKIRALANDPAAYPGERENARRLLAQYEAPPTVVDARTAAAFARFRRAAGDIGYAPPPRRHTRQEQAIAAFRRAAGAR